MIAGVIERAVRLARATSSTTSVALLVAFNVVPLVGVLAWHWSVATILVLYWVENGIVGALNIPKMLLASGPPGGSMAARPVDGVAMASKIGQIGFFLVHYGMFWLVHGVFVFTLPLFAGSQPGAGLPDFVVLDNGEVAFLRDTGASVGPDLTAVAWGSAGLAISHGASFVLNFVGRREYLKVTTAGQMFAPYGRLVILHVTIIVGAMVSLLLGSPIGAIVVLVILKTAVDVAFHIREHDRLEARTAPG
ncbi:MAG: hypothetical protein QOF49_33 [Chloroflexota bacterium]|jgi:hypothetical protein|nr:hypothetical protein [Chloroflexota bacterium]